MDIYFKWFIYIMINLSIIYFGVCKFDSALKRALHGDDE